MSRLAVLALGLLVAGCRKEPPIPEPFTPVAVLDGAVDDDAPIDRPVAAAAVVGPGRWSDRGLAVDVPAGWSAWVGADDVAVRVVHESGVAVWLRLPDAVPALPSPCRWAFDDMVGRHRGVPILYPSSTATCVPDAPDAPAVQAWWGRVDGRALQIEVRYPPGTLASGRDAAAAVLGSIGPG